MKIHTTKYLTDYNEYVYKINKIEDVCDDFYTVFPLKNDLESGDFGLCIEEYTHTVCYEDECDDYEYYPINYCPMCGKKIEIIVDSQVDKREYLKETKIKLNTLRKRIRETDSKSEERKLNLEYRELDDELNRWYYSDSIRKFLGCEQEVE